MRRTNARIDVGTKIKPTCASVLIWKNLRARGNIGLTRNARSPLDTARFQSPLKRSQQLRVLPQLQAKQISSDIARNIIGGWSETAGHKQNFRARKKFGERISNRCAIRNG